MKVSRLDEQFSVSDQIDASDVRRLGDAGVSIVVCNRPDGESQDQPRFSAIEAACKEHGIETHLLAFTGDQVETSHVEALLKLLSTGRRLHAYCRSGARSSKLWARARRRQNLDSDELVRRAGQFNYDVSRHV